MRRRGCMLHADGGTAQRKSTLAWRVPPTSALHCPNAPAAGMLLSALWQAAVFQALSLLAARRPAVYARHRELVTSVGQMFFSIYFVRTGARS